MQCCPLTAQGCQWRRGTVPAFRHIPHPGSDEERSRLERSSDCSLGRAVRALGGARGGVALVYAACHADLRRLLQEPHFESGW
jgi:hypothetical protein